MASRTGRFTAGPMRRRIGANHQTRTIRTDVLS
jgi:hypothetical protein